MFPFGLREFEPGTTFGFTKRIFPKMMQKIDDMPQNNEMMQKIDEIPQNNENTQKVGNSYEKIQFFMVLLSILLEKAKNLKNLENMLENSQNLQNLAEMDGEKEENYENLKQNSKIAEKFEEIFKQNSNLNMNLKQFSNPIFDLNYLKERYLNSLVGDAMNLRENCFFFSIPENPDNEKNGIKKIYEALDGFSSVFSAKSIKKNGFFVYLIFKNIFKFFDNFF